MSEMPDKNLYQCIVECYQEQRKVAAVVKELHIPASKVRRVLITEGLWSSPTSRKIAAFLSKELKKEEIAKKLHCSVKAVEFYLPYQRGAYGINTPSDTAKRIEGYRKRKAEASSSQVFYNNSPEAKMQSGFMDVHQLYQAVMEKPPRFLKVRLELLNDGIADDSVLRMYGKAKEGFTRDILISSSFTLHQLHYAIQRAYGWQNEHRHSFTFPKDTMMSLFSALAKDGQKEPLYADWEKLCGVYFRYPITNENDLHWDDDYDGTKSIRSWLRDKYTGEFQYRGYAEHCLECKGETTAVRDANPSVRVYPSFQAYKEATPENPGGRMVPIDEVSFNEANIVYLGQLVQLLERLPVSELLLPEETAAQQGWQEIVHNLIDTSVAANAGHMEKVKNLKKAIQEAIGHGSDEDAFYKAYGEYQEFVPQFDPHVVPIAKQLLYFYDYEAGWRVKITCQDVYYTKDGWDYPDENSWVRVPMTEEAFQDQTEAYGRGNESVNEELRQKMIRCHLDRRPQCLAADGMNVMEGVKGLSGFADFLLKIHDEDLEKRDQLLEWARNRGWNGRALKPENIL